VDDEIVWLYRPDPSHRGAYLYGIPRRDLTRRDLLAYGIDEARLAQAPYLYRRAEAAPAPPAAAPAPDAPRGRLRLGLTRTGSPADPAGRPRREG
jgi:hypothetical protein